MGEKLSDYERALRVSEWRREHPHEDDDVFKTEGVAGSPCIQDGWVQWNLRTVLYDT